jgi:hypothetical protein
MSVCGGGVKVALGKEREEWSSKERWKKYSGITGDLSGCASQQEQSNVLYWVCLVDQTST